MKKEITMNKTKKDENHTTSKGVNSNKLLPCPFCGSKAIVCAPLENITGYVIRCKNWGCCEKSVNEGTELEEIIKLWNTRTI